MSIAPAAVSQIAFTTDPGSAVAGAPFLVQPVVSTRDPFGNLSSIGLPDTLPVTVSPVSSADLLLGNAIIDLGLNAGRGIARYQDLRLDMAGSKQLRAVADVLDRSHPAESRVEGEHAEAI